MLCNAQDADTKVGEQYAARNRFVKEMTALGITFDHYGRYAKTPSDQCCY